MRLGTFAPLRCCNCPLGAERSHGRGIGFFPGHGGVRVGFQVPETLLNKRFSRIGQCPVIQSLVLRHFHAVVGIRTCPEDAVRDRFLPCNGASIHDRPPTPSAMNNKVEMVSAGDITRLIRSIRDQRVILRLLTTCVKGSPINEIAMFD